MLGKGPTSFFCIRISVFSAPFVEKTVLSPSEWFWHSSKIILPYLWGFISGLTVLFHWSICLSLWLYHSVLITILYNIVWNQEIWDLQLCFCFQDCLDYSASLEFLYEFQNGVSIFAKILLWNFDSDYIKSVDHFE